MTRNPLDEILDKSRRFSTQTWTDLHPIDSPNWAPHLHLNPFGDEAHSLYVSFHTTNLARVTSVDPSNEVLGYRLLIEVIWRP